MSEHAFSIDELERDLGLNARLRLIANAGGQRRYIPTPANVERSDLSHELGVDVACWLAGRFGGEVVAFPSRNAAEQQDRAAHLQAAVLEAGLTEPTRSANDIALQFGVTERRVRQLRAELRKSGPAESAPLPLFQSR